ncbi:hypothetical protein C8F01DRAFT_1093226 [Mycena amicta]|nr:hypothetical protein C8F01DRAFT_1093226 [Mycena amicta]
MIDIVRSFQKKTEPRALRQERKKDPSLLSWLRVGTHLSHPQDPAPVTDDSNNIERRVQVGCPAFHWIMTVVVAGSILKILTKTFDNFNKQFSVILGLSISAATDIVVSIARYYYLRNLRTQEMVDAVMVFTINEPHQSSQRDINHKSQNGKCAPRQCERGQQFPVYYKYQFYNNYETEPMHEWATPMARHDDEHSDMDLRASKGRQFRIQGNIAAVRGHLDIRKRASGAHQSGPALKVVSTKSATPRLDRCRGTKELEWIGNKAKNRLPALDDAGVGVVGIRPSGWRRRERS